MGPAHKPRSLPLRPPQRRIPPWGTRLPTLVTALVTFLGAFLTAPFLLGRFKNCFIFVYAWRMLWVADIG